MATKNKLKYGTILKRSSCLNSEATSVDSQKLFENLKYYIENSENGKDTGIQRPLRLYIESMSNVDNASNYYWQPFEIVSFLNSKNQILGDRVVKEYNERILPYVSDISNVKDSLKYNTTLLDSQKESILEFANLYEGADRVLNNHNMISKRFNLESEAKRYKNMGLKYLVDNCASKIDTYKIKSYQKLNITIEEVAYLLDKLGADYNKNELAEYAVEYFLLQNPYTAESEISDYKKILTENFVLVSEDLDKVSFLFNDTPISNINSMIQNFMISSDKYKIEEFIENILNSTTIKDIIYNIDKIVVLLWDLVKNQTYEDNTVIYRSIEKIESYLKNILFSDYILKVSNSDIQHILDNINSIETNITNSGNINASLTKDCVEFCGYIDNTIKKTLSEYLSLIYNSENISNIEFLNSSNEIIPMNEFKVFKFHNLINASLNLNKFLKVKEKKIFDKGSMHLTKIRNKLTDILFENNSYEKSDIYKYIGQDNKADICVRMYEFAESEFDQIKSFCIDICNEYNDVLNSQGNNTIRSYYIVNPGIIEIHVKESASISDLTDKDKELIESTINPSDYQYLKIMMENDYMLSGFEKYNRSIVETISSCEDYSKFDINKLELACEALSYISDISMVKLLAEKVIDYQFDKALDNGIINESYLKLANQESKINNIIESWEPKSDTSIDIKLEAYNYFNLIMESMADDWDLDDDDEENEKDNKENNKSSKPESKKEESKEKEKEDTGIKDDKFNPNTTDVDGMYRPSRSRKKISLNGIKLGLKGLQTKFKDMNNKQKEMSKNMDNSVRALVKGMKDTMTNDRREAIIKGSVIPSFSRCLKNGIALAFLGIASQNVAVPVIAAIGGLAMSKRLNKKERLLLLDEIETELEVIDKELQLADSNNQINKYRALLQYKKELQRQYQRIRYNIRVGKDIVSSTNGVPGNNE